MQVDDGQLQSAFRGGAGLYCTLMRQLANVQTLEILPRQGAPLFLAGASLKVPCDSTLAPIVLATHAWQPEELAFVRQVVGADQPVDLVDVGANIGMFTRQVRAALPNVVDSYCYEPDPANFELLQHNLRPFPQANLMLVNAALADDDGEATFAMEVANRGNGSLTAGVMGGAYYTQTVQLLKTARESQRWLASGRKVFYKSDTQGHDQAIATAIDEACWDVVVGGIMELWRVEAGAYDPAAFGRILDRFAHKVFLGQPTVLLSTAQVLTFLEGRDGAFADLGFW
jgi:FkbM family methyltransferase